MVIISRREAVATRCPLASEAVSPARKGYGVAPSMEEGSYRLPFWRKVSALKRRKVELEGREWSMEAGPGREVLV